MKLLDDIATVTGLGVLAYAGYMVHPALCWAIAGGGLLAVGIGGQLLRIRAEQNGAKKPNDS